MKNFFLLLFAVMGLGMNANAQSDQCVIAGSDNATFSAYIGSYDHESGSVTVYAQNDSDKAVTGTVTVRWGTKSRSITILVQGNSETKKEITLGKGFSPSSSPEIEVRSARCASK